MKIKKGFSLRKVMGQNIVMAEGAYADTYDKILVLNPSATILWEKLAGANFTADTAAAILADTYEVSPEQARAHADDFVAALASKGVIE